MPLEDRLSTRARRHNDLRFYTEADLVRLSLAVTVDVRFVPTAEVARHMIGQAKAIARHVRSPVETGLNCRPADAWS